MKLQLIKNRVSAATIVMSAGHSTLLCLTIVVKFYSFKRKALSAVKFCLTRFASIPLRAKSNISLFAFEALFFKTLTPSSIDILNIDIVINDKNVRSYQTRLTELSA